MKVEVITTGTELLLGEILNTNFTWLAQQLNLRGFDVLYQTTVGDNPKRMKEILDIAAKRADIIITSGGLGPTRGDITKEMIAEHCGVDMYMNLEVWNHIHDLLSKRNICIAENNEKQALVPSGAIVLHNEAGTAPGLILEHGGKTFIMLPGPPFELKNVCEKELFPYFEQRFPHLGIIKSHTLKLLGIGESNLAEMLDDIIVHQSNPTIALYARRGEILIRLTAKASTEEGADALIANMQEKVEKVVGTYVYGYDDETLPEVLGKELLSRQQTIAFAESCTGGLVSSMMTDVPGSSEYLKGSVISYTDVIKNQVIHVSKTTLSKKGAVSEETAIEMARGAREVIGSDIAISITGLAGPGGGTRKKPVGLVYIAVADANGEACRKFNFGGTRTQIKHRAAMAAMGFALDRLKESSHTNAEETIHDHDADR